MIELADIQLSYQEDIVELSNKLLTLFLQLNFDEMKSVNYVTKVTDIAHHLYNASKSVKLNLTFEKKGHTYVLLINMTTPVTELTDFSNLHIYPSLGMEVDQDSAGDIKLYFPILEPSFKTDDATLQKLKEQVIIQSKSELLREVKHKNVELNKLLEDLKKSSGLIQSEKMRALGVLTAGVAHELNNPMMGILNFIQYCIKKTDPDDKRYEALKDAERETKRCIEIVSNLLTFSHLEKEGAEEFKPVNLSVLLTRVIKLLQYRLRNEEVTVNENIQANCQPIMGHENRLQQIILNLVTNALDAMKKAPSKCLTVGLSDKTSHLTIEIADTGEGMDEDTQQKIFDPFFTTKPTGSGTGLGLSVCESIVKEHGGKIICRSEKNKGTQFLIILPLIAKE